MCKKKCNYLMQIIISIIMGVLIGYAHYLGLLTGIASLLWIALGTAGIGLILLIALILFYKRESEKCICINLAYLTIGTLLTLALSVIALSIALIIGEIWAAILIGTLGTAIVISFISMARLLCCLISKM